MTDERGVIRQEGFSGTSLTRVAETASTAAAATAKAKIEAQYIVAMNRPRNIDLFRTKILDTCRRPRFAEMARYKKPVAGGFIEGMSIRFADEALKLLSNAVTDQEVIYEDDEQQIVRVTVTDLETNMSKSDNVIVKKIVERKKAVDREIVGERTNTSGAKVYLVRATDDELLNKRANLCAKIRRNLELQIIPQDIIEECEDEVINTMRNRDKEDPDAARRKILDAFAAIGIMPDRIAEYLGHSTEKLSPAEFQTLREIGAAIRDGQTTWEETIEAKGVAKKKAERATVNLDDIKPGDTDTHTAVDAPVRGKKPLATDAKPSQFEEAYAKLSRLYNDNADAIDAMLAKFGATKDLIGLQNATKGSEIVAVIRTAEEFKPRKDAEQ